MNVNDGRAIQINLSQPNECMEEKILCTKNICLEKRFKVSI